jgi:hypothetical protein
MDPHGIHCSSDFNRPIEVVMVIIIIIIIIIII